MSWGLLSTIIIIVAILLLFFWAQKAAISSKEIALLAAFIAVAALGRIPFAAIPSVQPTTFIVMLTACVFGSRAGFLVGASSALVSNFFLGQGPWTPWQMIGWGLIGTVTGYLYRLFPDIKTYGLAIIGMIWGYIFGWIQNLGFCLVFVYPINIKSLTAAYSASIVFDTLHGLCNFCLLLFFASPVIKIFKEFQERFYIRTNSMEKSKPDY